MKRGGAHSHHEAEAAGVAVVVDTITEVGGIVVVVAVVVAVTMIGSLVMSFETVTGEVVSQFLLD